MPPRFRVSTLTGYSDYGRTECVSWYVHDSALCYATVYQGPLVSLAKGSHLERRRAVAKSDAQKVARKLEADHA